MDFDPTDRNTEAGEFLHFLSYVEVLMKHVEGCKELPKHSYNDLILSALQMHPLFVLRIPGGIQRLFLEDNDIQEKINNLLGKPISHKEKKLQIEELRAKSTHIMQKIEDWVCELPRQNEALSLAIGMKTCTVFVGKRWELKFFDVVHVERLFL